MNTLRSPQFERYQVLFSGICALVLTLGLSRFAYTPLLPIMRNQAGLSVLAGGWLATINYAGYMTGAILASSISNLQLKYRLYKIGLVLAVVSTITMGMTQSVVAWGIMRFIGGFSSMTGMLIGSGLLMNWLMRKGHKPELGLHFTGLGLGIAVSGTAVALMSSHLGWDQQWMALGVFGILFFIPAWLWLPPPEVPASSSQTTRNAALNQTPRPSQSWMWLLIAAYFCGGFGYVISATFTVDILVHLPLLKANSSWVWVIVGLAATPSCFLWDKVASNLGHVKALILAYVVQTFSLVLPIMTEGAALNILGAVLFGITFVGIVSLTLTLVGLHFKDNPAKAMARMTLSFGVAQIVAPAMAGAIAHATGSYHWALVVTALVMLSGVGLLVLLLREENRTYTGQQKPSGI